MVSVGEAEGVGPVHVVLAREDGVGDGDVSVVPESKIEYAGRVMVTGNEEEVEGCNFSKAVHDAAVDPLSPKQKSIEFSQLTF